MSNVLFLGMPSHGHVNPSLGLVHELVSRGETVTYFAAEPFRERIERVGATFRGYSEDLDIFRASNDRMEDGEMPALYRVVRSGPAVIADILARTRGQHFDYLIHSAAFPFTKPMKQIVGLPTVASHAVFAGLDFFFRQDRAPEAAAEFPEPPEHREIYRRAVEELSHQYGVTMPPNVLGLIFNRGDLNLVYTSRYFAAHLDYFDDTFRFVGPPAFARGERVEFPFERLEGQTVLYISLGTVFGSARPELYRCFFDAFRNWDGVVVLAAYGVDDRAFEVPPNFIVRGYVPQSELLAHTHVAVTHCGMNSMNDLLVHEVPFVALPLGADQPDLAARAAELGAALVLDAESVSPDALRDAVERVRTEPGFREAIRTINASFRDAGGYPRAVDEVFRFKHELGIA